jgi:hypothetical protein
MRAQRSSLRFPVATLYSFLTHCSFRQTPINMSSPIDPKSPAGVEVKDDAHQVEHAYDADEKPHISKERADAIEAENLEHSMGVLEAVRAYPMATLWAFVMSCTIVSCLLPPSPTRHCS